MTGFRVTYILATTSVDEPVEAADEKQLTKTITVSQRTAAAFSRDAHADHRSSQSPEREAR